MYPCFNKCSIYTTVYIKLLSKVKIFHILDFSVPLLPFAGF